MKAKTASPETAVLTAERKLHNTWVYIKRHWQLYLLFLLPAVALTLVFKYAPMGGVLIAFQKILLPVCMPVVAVLALWQFVAMWNSYFDAMIYLNSASKQPLQLVLRSILIQSQPESGMIADIQSTAERAKMAELLKYATIIISSLPLLVMYPFFQKYFDAGIMAGSIKG